MNEIKRHLLSSWWKSNSKIEKSFSAALVIVAEWKWMKRHLLSSWWQSNSKKLWVSQLSLQVMKKLNMMKMSWWWKPNSAIVSFSAGLSNCGRLPLQIRSQIQYQIQILPMQTKFHNSGKVVSVIVASCHYRWSWRREDEDDKDDKLVMKTKFHNCGWVKMNETAPFPNSQND